MIFQRHYRMQECKGQDKKRDRRDNACLFDTARGGDHALVGNLVLVVLDHVVRPRPEVEEGLLDDADHVGGGLQVRGLGLQTVPVMKESKYVSFSL